jgi:hypothetical protein
MDAPQNTEEPAIVVRSKFADLLFNSLKTQGFPVLLLCLVAWYLNSEVKELKMDFKSCYESRIETSERREAKLIEVVSNNTHALERFIREEQYRQSRER